MKKLLLTILIQVKLLKQRMYLNSNYRRKISFRRFALIEADAQHFGACNTTVAVSVLSLLLKGGDSLAKQISMHIAMKPTVLSYKELDDLIR